MQTNKITITIAVLAVVAAAGFFALGAKEGGKKPGKAAKQPTEAAAKDETASQMAQLNIPAPLPIPESLMVDGKPADPLCFMAPGVLANGPSIALKGCGDIGFKRNDAPDNGYVAREGFTGSAFTVGDENPETMLRGFVEYKYVGPYKDGEAVLSVWNTGGSGLLSTILVVKRDTPDTLAISERVIGGGDRCNNGVGNAWLDGTDLVYTMNLTPFDLLVFSGDNPQNLEPMKDLEDSAAGCYATAVVRNSNVRDIMFNDAIVENIKTKRDAGVDLTAIQRCFDDVFMKKLDEKPGTMSLDGLRTFIQGFNESCKKADMPESQPPAVQPDGTVTPPAATAPAATPEAPAAAPDVPAPATP